LLTQFAISWPFNFPFCSMFASALPRESRPSEICVEIRKDVKNIPDIIDHNLKKHYQILIISGKIFLTPLAIKWLFKFLSHPTSAPALRGENRPSKLCVKINEKKSINSIYPDLWPPIVSRLQGLTVIQQCVYQMAFRDVYEFKKWLAKSGLVWSRTLSILPSMKGESVSIQCANISSNFIASSWKNKTIR